MEFPPSALYSQDPRNIDVVLQSVTADGVEQTVPVKMTNKKGSKTLTKGSQKRALLVFSFDT